MAEGVRQNEQTNPIVYCSLCKNVFTDPRKMDCLHHFCLNCIKKQLENSDKKNLFVCGQCGGCQQIPAGGAELLPVSDLMTNLVKAAEYQQQEDQTGCDICRTDVTAPYRCGTCHMSLCEFCYKTNINKRAFLKDHKPLPKAEFKKMPLDHVCKIISNKEICHKDGHDQELRYYCQTCKLAICSDCRNTTCHQHEDVILIKDQCKEANENVGNIAMEFKKLIKFGEGQTEKLDGWVVKIHATGEQSIEAIRNHKAQLMEKIEAYCTQQEDDIRRRSRENIDAVHDQKHAVEEQLSCLQNSQDLANVVIACGRPAETTQICTELENKLKQHKEIQLKEPRTVGYGLGDLSCFNAELLLGQVAVDKILIKPLQINSFKLAYKPSGIAMRQDGTIVIIGYDSGKADIFPTNGNHVRSLKQPENGKGPSKPGGVCVTPTDNVIVTWDKRMYIYDDVDTPPRKLNSDTCMAVTSMNDGRLVAWGCWGFCVWSADGKTLFSSIVINNFACSTVVPTNNDIIVSNGSNIKAYTSYGKLKWEYEYKVRCVNHVTSTDKLIFASHYDGIIVVNTEGMLTHTISATEMGLAIPDLLTINNKHELIVTERVTNRVNTYKIF